MTDALKTVENLSDAEKAFIAGGQNSGKALSTVRNIPNLEDRKILEAAEESLPPLATKVKKPRTSPSLDELLNSSMVSFTSRIPQELQRIIMRASFDRKINEENHSSQQDIITEAILDWCKARGLF